MVSGSVTLVLWFQRLSGSIFWFQVLWLQVSVIPMFSGT